MRGRWRQATRRYHSSILGVVCSIRGLPFAEVSSEIMSLHLPVLESAPPARSPSQRQRAAAARAKSDSGPLIDSHGRSIRDLRLSITDRCNFRCTYCLDPSATFMSRAKLLTAQELVRATSICVSLGVRKVRITGGEPTLHPELDRIVRELAALAIDDLAMTSNGTGLSRDRLERLRDLGLRRLTLSLDSLRQDRFHSITRSTGRVDDVLGVIRSARDCGLDPVRVNAVIVRGVNDDEVIELAAMAHDLGVEMRFIEFMPLDSARAWDATLVVSADEILQRVASRFELERCADERGDSTSMNYVFTDGSPGGIGLIAPVSRPFCGACSRLRITADGRVRPCLFSHDEWDLREAMRTGASDDDVARILREATWGKQAGHGIGGGQFTPPERTMSAIGG